MGQKPSGWEFIALASWVERWCGHCIIDKWVLYAMSFGIPFDEGLRFPRLKGKGWYTARKSGRQRISLTPCRAIWRGITSTNVRLLNHLNMGDCQQLETGQDLERTVYLAFMKNKITAQNYAKGQYYLFPKQNWKKAGIDTSEIDSVTLALQMQSWRAWKNEGPSMCCHPVVLCSCT